jgi:DNA-binding MarR family transcriptional regulator
LDDPDGIARCNCHSLRRAARRLTHDYDRTLAPSGVKATQLPVLAQLRNSGPLPIGGLAERLGLDRATLGHNIRPMLAQGWLQMAPGADRRRRELTLTDAGVAALAAALPLWRQAQARFEADFGPARAASLRREAAAVG